MIETSQPSLDAALTRQFTAEYNYSGYTFEFKSDGFIYVSGSYAGTWSLSNNKLRIDLGYGGVDYDVVIKDDVANLKADMRAFYADYTASYGITLKKATLEMIFRRV